MEHLVHMWMPMRSLGLVVALAACGTGDGAVLSFEAPDGPGAASRIEVVLASASSDSMTATQQRKRRGDLATEGVVYYRQRSSVDAILGVASVDGFELRIEPEALMVADEQMIPFALIYDSADVLIGVGTVNDDLGKPTFVTIKPGVVQSYDLSVLALAPDDDAAGIGPGEGHAVGCESDAGSWRSGAVWKRADGPQIRLLLPDLAEDVGATDAMLRSSDLDCDAHAASDAEDAEDADDCDDLRAAYHPGQTETCDGEDKDCDGRRLEVIEGCAVANSPTCGTTGIALCIEAPDQTPVQSTCRASAACACTSTAGGTPSPGCAGCALGWTTATAGGTPCAPSIGKMHFEQCTTSAPCTIDLVEVIGPWEIKIAAAAIGPYSNQVIGLTNDVYIRATYLGTTVPVPSAPTLGAANLGVTGGTQQARAAIVPVNLNLELQPVTACAPGTGSNSMRCYQ